MGAEIKETAITERDLERVTWHAIVRYVQRVLNVSVPDVFRHERSRAEAHCAAAGVSPLDVRRAIMTPFMVWACQRAVGSGGTIHAPRFKAEISDTGVIVTVAEPRKRERLRIFGDKEGRRSARRHARRLKGRA